MTSISFLCAQVETIGADDRNVNITNLAIVNSHWFSKSSLLHPYFFSRHVFSLFVFYLTFFPTYRARVLPRAR